jgi:TatD DNase family protein
LQFTAARAFNPIVYLCGMMTFVDTHAHHYLQQFDNDRDAMLDRAMAAGCEAFFLPNIDSTTIDSMLALEASRPDVCFAMMGLHPSHVKENFREELALCETWLRRRRFAAVGEIGIDLYWDKTFLQEQLEALHIQMGWAKELDLPIVLHTREAMDIVIDAVAEAHDASLRGVFHCFNGNVAQAERIVGMGFYLGIGGVLTYKNGGLEPVIEALGLDHVVLETDAPYLAPIPMRGKRNESAYITYVIDRLANLTGLRPEEVGEKTTANARRLFAESFVLAPAM